MNATVRPMTTPPNIPTMMISSAPGMEASFEEMWDWSNGPFYPRT
jgi:hypothetical protein